jgi:hypothetical protein
MAYGYVTWSGHNWCRIHVSGIITFSFIHCDINTKFIGYDRYNSYDNWDGNGNLFVD